MENQPNSDYVKYLEQTLRKNNISFLTQSQFVNHETKKRIKREEQVQEQGRLETNMTVPLVGDLIQRYSRQMLLKEIAYEGQLKIVEAKIAIIGAGGIGCPLAMYLAGAGVGTLGLFDSDVVDLTNLHRQVGHNSSKIGWQKTKSLKETLNNLNPNINITENTYITPENVNGLDEYDLIIDGSDNPQCRYIVNDYCMSKKKKLLSGACIGWEAQITCYGGEGDSPCYRCLWGNDQVSFGGCSSLGVVGMLPGYVGLILAIQAIKLLINGKSSLQGTLLTYEAKKCEFKKLKLRRKLADCIACGKNKLQLKDFDYSKYGNCSTGNKVAPSVPSKTWQQYLKSNRSLILDVRPSSQYNIVNFKTSINIPFEVLSKMKRQEILKYLNVQESPENQSEQIPVSCNRGVMSRYATEYLLSLNIKSFSIEGGIMKYKSLFDRGIPQL